MKKIIIGLTAAILGLWGMENEAGLVGYARIQTSFDDAKANSCFKAPGAGSKYRLGNECETWIEFGFYDEVKFDNGVVMHTQVRPVFTAPNNRHIEYLQTDEAYAEFSNIFDNSVSLWVGRRFYDRYDSHINDYFFFNMSGDGAGFRNLDVGGPKLSYSYVYDKLDPPGVLGREKVLFDSHDVRLLLPIQRGEWTLFANAMSLHAKEFSSTQRIEHSDGFAAGVLYKDKKITQELFGMDGENICGLFYGEGVAKGAGSSSPYRQDSFADSVVQAGNTINDAQTWRWINYNDFANDTWGMMSNLVYEKRDERTFSSTKQTWMSAGIRPYWFFHKNGRLVFEGGADRVKDELNHETYTLTKETLALEAALDKGVWKRPVFRVYYTHADWSDNAMGRVGGAYYANQTHGDNVGLQVEHWW